MASVASVAPARSTVWTGYGALLLIGVYVAALGPGLPGLAAHAHEPLQQAGTLFSALFAGGLLTSALAGRAMDRTGARPLLVAGAVANGLGCAALAASGSWTAVLGSGLLMGVGDTLVVVASHVLFAGLYPNGAGAALNRLNVFFGVGALLGPGLAGLAIVAFGDIRVVLLGVTVGQMTVVLSLLRAPAAVVAPAAHGGEALGMRELGRLPLLWLLGLLLFIYVGLEIGLGNWAYSYLRSGGAFPVVAASLVSSGYWLALTLGRVLCPFVLRRMPDRALLRTAASAAAVGALVLVLVAGWRGGGAACILLLGLCFGPIWPLTFALAAGAFPRGVGASSGLLAMAGSVGGLALPWLQGLLLHAGARQGMALTLAGCVGMALLATAVSRRLARTEGSCVSTS